MDAAGRTEDHVLYDWTERLRKRWVSGPTPRYLTRLECGHDGEMSGLGDDGTTDYWCETCGQLRKRGE